MSSLNSGPGLFVSLNNINPPTDLSDFQSYIDAGLSRFTVFAFVPNNNLPTTADWYTTNAGGQPQGLDTYGTGTTDAWASFFDLLVNQNVQVGFTFGGAGATQNLGTMIGDLNASSSDFADFVSTLQGYNVSYVHFDIEGTWDTSPDFSTNFQQFAENLSSVSNGTIAVEVGASAPVGTVDGSSSYAPSYLTQSFAQDNNVFFNVYTYYDLEVSNVVDSNTPWIPSDTSIAPSQILFSVTCNATTPAPSGQIDYTDFMNDFPNSDLLATVQNDGYLGFTTWIWWHDTSDYPPDNCLDLFQATAP